MDIKSNFNLLLGRPWLHGPGFVPSTLHQKIKFLLDGALITINASPLKIQHHVQPIINIEHDENDEDLWGFTVAMLEEEDKAPFDFDPHSNLSINALLRNQGYFPGMALGVRSTSSFPSLDLVDKNDTYGLGYTLTKEDAKETHKKKIARRTSIEMMIRPYPHTLNGQYIKQGDVYPYYEFPEPFIRVDGIRYPGIEVFSYCNFLNEGVTEQKSALDYSCTYGLGILFGQETNSLTE